MKILAVDIGTGTQDIMFYDSNQNIENSIKLVLPSPTRIIGNKIRNSKNDILITGETMGGGPVNRAIMEKIQKGHEIIMTENAARTIRDDLDRVKAYGIKIISENKLKVNEDQYSGFDKIVFKDVDLVAIEKALKEFNVKLEFDFLGVAVQDHGYMEGMGDRNFRFMKIKEKLDVPLKPEQFSYFKTAPDYFTRMKAVSRLFNKYNLMLMDSKFASICGATCDDTVKSLDKFVAMDVGNGHTLAAAFDGEKIVGVFEHHTRSLNKEKIELYVKKLVKGTLTHDEIHSDNGHGAWVLEELEDIECIVATGPKRKLLNQTGYNIYHAAPAGDVMMTGPVGLIKAINTI